MKTMRDRWRMFHCMAGIVGCMILLDRPVVAQLPTAGMQSLSARAWTIGQPIQFAIEGDRLQWPQQLWIHDSLGQRREHDGQFGQTAARPLEESGETQSTFSMHVPATWEPGLVWVRTSGRFGTSNSRPVLLTSGPVFRFAESHFEPAAAQPVDDGIVDDRIPSGGRCYFRIALSPGQTLRSVAYAGPVDSLAALVLNLKDDSDRTLASSRTVGDWPARLEYTLPENAAANTDSEETRTLLLEVHDLLYRGGPGFEYLLEIRRQNDDGSLELDRSLAPQFEKNRRLETGLSGFEVVQRQWPTESVSIPYRYEGTLASANQLSFQAKAGQAIRIRLDSESSGFLTDPRVQIVRKAADGNETVVVDQDDFAMVGTVPLRLRYRDPDLVWTAPEDGEFYLRVLDQQGGDREETARQFRLAILPVQPEFEVYVMHRFPTATPAAASPLGSALRQGGTEGLQVQLVRRPGFGGPVRVQAEGLPEGLTCRPLVLAANQDQGVLVLESSGEAAMPLGFELKVSGTALELPAAEPVAAVVADVYRAADPVHNAPRVRRDPCLMLGTVSETKTPLQIHWPESATVVQGATVEVGLQLVRSEQAKGECTIRALPLPPGVTLAEVKVAGDQLESKVALVVADSVAPGSYAINLLCETKVQWQPFPEALQREQAYLDRLNAAVADPAAAGLQAEMLTALIEQVKQKVEALKADANAREVTVWVPVAPLTLVVEKKPE